MLYVEAPGQAYLGLRGLVSHCLRGPPLDPTPWWVPRERTDEPRFLPPRTAPSEHNVLPSATHQTRPGRPISRSAGMEGRIRKNEAREDMSGVPITIRSSDCSYDWLTEPQNMPQRASISKTTVGDWRWKSTRYHQAWEAPGACTAFTAPLAGLAPMPRLPLTSHLGPSTVKL